MRVRTGVIAAVLVVGLIAGCRADGDAERQAMIDQEIKDCVDGFSKSRGGAAGLNGESICQCAVGKLTEGKTAAEIKTFTQQARPSEADLQTMGGCVVEEARRKGLVAK